MNIEQKLLNIEQKLLALLKRIKDLEEAFKRQQNQVIFTSSSGGGSGGGSGKETFKELNDTPANYTGQAGKVVQVKADETGLEFNDENFVENGHVKIGNMIQQ
jgi:hypothetical protein